MNTKMAVLLCSLAVAAAGMDVCGTNGNLELCVALDSELETVLSSCNTESNYTVSSGTHSLPGTVKYSGTAFATMLSSASVLTCETQVLAVEFHGYANLLNTNLIDLTAAASLTIRMDSGALTWDGSIEGTIATIGILEASFELLQSETAVKTLMHIDIEDTEMELALPSRVSLDLPGAPFFDGSLVSSSCPLTPLVGLPELSVPGVDAGLEVTGVSFDPCALMDSSSTKPVLVLGAALNTEYDLRGLKLPSLETEVSIGRDSEGVTFAGSLSATIEMFGSEATVAGEFDGSELLSVSVDFDATYGGLSMQGSLTFVDSCSTENSGSATLSIPDADFTAACAIAQLGCVSGTTTPLWDVTASVDSATVSQVAVSSMLVHLTSSEGSSGTVWTGDASGTVTVGEGTVSASVSFDSTTGVTAFSVAGSIENDIVTGSVDLAVADGVATGTAAITAAPSNAAIPEFTATVSHVFNYNADNAHLPLWSITGDLASWTVFGVELTNVHIDLQGAVAGGPVKWSGSISGTAAIDDTEITVTTTLEDNALTSLVGDLTVNGNGATFEGSIEITPDREQGCAPIAGSGTLTLTTGQVFDAAMSFDECAAALDEERFTFEGTLDGDLTMDGLTLSSVGFVLHAKIANAATRALTWSGTLQATANLFGASSSAKVVFADGAFESVDVVTSFSTDNLIFSSTVAFTYKSGCEPVTGTIREATLRLDGANDLVFTGGMTYESCSGVMTINGAIDAWNGPGATSLSGVSIALTSSSNGGDASSPLAGRSWTGTVTAQTSAGLEFSLDFDSSSSASSVTGTITFEDTNVKISVAVSSDCTGTGTLILRNLDNIPAIETQVAFSKSCGSPSKAWAITGTFDGLAIPFHSKVINLPTVTVSVVQGEDGKKTVSVNGNYLSSFILSLDFTVGGPIDVTLRGALKSGSSVSPDSFSSEFSGGSQFSSSIGNAGGMLSSMKNLNLNNVALEVSFSEKSISLTADGQVFGIDFSILVSFKKQGTWLYGMAFTAENFANADGLPGPIKTVLSSMGPDYIRLSVAKNKMTVGDVTLRKGLSIAASLPLDGGVIGDVLSVAPSDMKSQIQAAGASGGLLLFADIVSTTELNIFVQLAGNIPLGGQATLRTIALAFSITTGGPEMGFNVELDFTLGSGSNAQDFTAIGFISLSAGGLGVEISLNSATPWVNPFGISNVKVLFPLAIGMTISPALLPSSFQLIGGLEVAGTSGKITISVDVKDFTKTAFRAQVNNFNLNKIVTSIANCNTCLGKVGNTLTTASIKSFDGSFNPDPVNAVDVTVAGVSSTVPAGINLEIVDLNLWNVIKVSYAQFSVKATGLKATLILDKMNWGPIQITSSNGRAGPSFDLELTKEKQSLEIDGRARILGSYVSIYLHMADDGIYGNFMLSLGSNFNVQVEIEATGTPGKSNFHNQITATMEGDLISAIIAQATAFLDSLSDAADKATAAAKKDLDAAKKDLDNANKELQNVEDEVTGELKGARNKVSSLSGSLSRKKSSCKSKEKKCKKKFWTCGAVPVCWTEYAAIAAAKATAEGALTVLIKATEGALDVARGAVNTAKGVVTATQKTMDAVSKVTDAFGDIVSAVGGALSNVLKINYLSFTAGLSSSSAAVGFSASLEIVKQKINFSFNVNPSFSAIKAKIESFLRSELKKVYGSLIPSL
eukprot:TRINITY_DN3998_c0_g6_i1.p1 TRINITY_DN3998_c0_g6~~TRINITY_DN3998_c0_g6_i1.p1  ORF type:complete len:1677 (+),score=492.28 TRINITY_DN3998_c0_g6_i1:50-5080(+)